MSDLSKLTIPELEALQAGGLSALNVDALTRLQGTPDPAASVAPTTSMGRVGDFLGRNMEIPGSVAGGLAGAAAGTAIMPGVGTIIGGILGGAIGAFGGSLGSNAYQDEALDFEDAISEAGISAGFDVATLGMGKLLRPIAKTLSLNTADLLINVTGRNAVKPAAVLSELPTNIVPGSPESRQLTQQLLETGEGSLSAGQTGQASFWRRTMDEIGQLGLFSGGISAKRVANNNTVLLEESQRLINGLDPSLTRVSEDVGEEVYGIVEAGRQAAESLYGEGLQQINKEFGGRSINLSRMRTLSKTFTDKFTNKIIGDTLDPSAKTVLDTMSEGVFTVRQAPLESLLELDVILGQHIKQALPGTSTANPRAFRQLSEFRTQFRESLRKTLADQAPVAGRAYALIKKNYGEAMTDLLPELSQSVVRQADRGNFESIGRLLIKQGNVGKINKMMDSVDRAFADIGRANAGKTGEDIISTGVASAAEAKRMMRQSWMQHTIKGLQSDTVDFSALSSLAKRLNEPEALKHSRAIMREDFGQYRRLVNAIADSTVDDKRGLFNLAIRSQEINAVGRVAGTVGGAGAAASFVGLPLAAAVLTVPSVFAKIATNKRAVNRLLVLNGEVARNANITPELVASGMAKVMAELSSEERTSIQRDLRIR